MKSAAADLVLFDLDNTLLAGDSDYEWAQFLIDAGVLERAVYESKNDEFFRQYRAGTLDIGEFLDFQLAPLARFPRAQLDAWHRDFMQERIRPIVRPKARALVARHLAEGSLCAIITATNSFVTAPIARDFGIANLIATEPELRAGLYTGKAAGMPCYREGKVVRLLEWLAGRETRLDAFASSCFYSDSHNDLALLEQVTRPIAVDPDETLRRRAAERGWQVISLE